MLPLSFYILEKVTYLCCLMFILTVKEEEDAHSWIIYESSGGQINSWENANIYSLLVCTTTCTTSVGWEKTSETPDVTWAL